MLEDEWHNFKFEVLRKCRYADDNWRMVSIIAAEHELDWFTLSMIARAKLSFNAENATIERGFSPLARLKAPPRNRRLPFTYRTKLAITVWHMTIGGQVNVKR